MNQLWWELKEEYEMMEYELGTLTSYSFDIQLISVVLSVSNVHVLQSHLRVLDASDNELGFASYFTIVFSCVGDWIVSPSIQEATDPVQAPLDWQVRT